MRNERAMKLVTDVAAERDGPPHLWSDLLARRNALGLRREELAHVLRVDDREYRACETGALPIGLPLIDELMAMEQFVDDETNALLDAAPQHGVVVLSAVPDQADFERSHPTARSLRGATPYPATLQHVAAGRAAAILNRRERDVVVRRADRSADLFARRLAVGLLKRETADLLGVNERHYFTLERGIEPAPVSLVSDLQAIDDFIQLSGLMLSVSHVDGAAVVHMLDDQAAFERAFPRARTVLGVTPYPVRVHRIAAARRAQRLAVAGTRTRIAVVGQCCRIDAGNSSPAPRR